MFDNCFLIYYNIGVHKYYIKETIMEHFVEERINKYFLVKDNVPGFNQNNEYTFLNDLERDHFEERAAIIEYDGNVSRKKAERLAYDCILEKRENYAKAS